MASGKKEKTMRRSSLISGLCALTCSCSATEEASFYGESLDATIEGCDFDEAHELRAQYVPWDDFSEATVQRDPITRELTVCIQPDYALFEEDPSAFDWCRTIYGLGPGQGWASSSSTDGTLELKDAEGNPATATYAEDVAFEFAMSIDSGALVLDAIVTRTRTCEGACDEIPAGTCTVSIRWVGVTSDDASFLDDAL